MKLLITDKLFPDLIEQFKKHYDVIYNESGKAWTEQQILQKIKVADILLCQLYDPITENVINSAPNLKMIANCAAGYNNIDLESAGKKNILVTNTPDVLTDATADLTWALILGITRRLKEGIHLMENNEFSGWNLHLLLGADLREKTLGIIGAGKIGTAVMARSKGWDMKILYTNRTPNKKIELKYGAVHKSLPDLLKESDIISLHCPLTAETKHLITLSELKMMKKSAYLINTARGAVVKESDLELALREKIIAGAAADVFEFEPKVSTNLLKMSNFLATPHIGSATESTRRKMVKMCLTAINTFILEKKIPYNTVLNPV